MLALHKEKSEELVEAPHALVVTVESLLQSWQQTAPKVPPSLHLARQDYIRKPFRTDGLAKLDRSY